MTGARNLDKDIATSFSLNDPGLYINATTLWYVGAPRTLSAYSLTSRLPDVNNDIVLERVDSTLFFDNSTSGIWFDGSTIYAAVPVDPVTAPYYIRAYSNQAQSGGLALNLDLDGGYTNEFDNVLFATAKWGRSESSYLAKVLPAQMLITLDNTSGRYDVSKILPRARINIDYQVGGIEHTHLSLLR